MANPNPSPATRFQPGENKPKQKEARDRISRAFLVAFADDFETNGKQAIVDMREQDVVSYVKTAAALLPKEVEHRHVLEGVDDNQIASMIEELQTVVAARAARVQH